jgi:hypothetical protein
MISSHILKLSRRILGGDLVRGENYHAELAQAVLQLDHELKLARAALREYGPRCIGTADTSCHRIGVVSVQGGNVCRQHARREEGAVSAHASALEDAERETI